MCFFLLCQLAEITCVSAPAPLYNCVCCPPPRSPTPCWRIAVGTTSTSVLTRSWGSSILRLCLTAKPKAPTCWRFSLWMVGSQRGQANMDSPTLVRKTDTAQSSLRLNCPDCCGVFAWYCYVLCLSVKNRNFSKLS